MAGAWPPYFSYLLMSVANNHRGQVAVYCPWITIFDSAVRHGHLSLWLVLHINVFVKQELIV